MYWCFKSNFLAPLQLPNPKNRLEAIGRSHAILCKSIKELHGNRLIYILLSCLLTALLLVTTLIDDSGPFGIIILFLQLVATLVLGFCFWMALIVNKIEYSALFSACKAMEVLTNALMNEYNVKISTDFSPTSSEVILWNLYLLIPHNFYT